MGRTLLMTAALAGWVWTNAVAQQIDYYRHLRYPKGLVPGVGLNQVEQEGGPNAVGYKRRTVQWWPRKGQDIVDIPEGAPLRTWTRNKGQEDKEALAGVARNWTASDPETFQAHLIAFRGFGTSTVNLDPSKNQILIPAAVLRMENGEQRAVINYGPVSNMISAEDHDFIHKLWEEAYPRLYATVSQEEHLRRESDKEWAYEIWKGAFPRFNGIPSRKDEAEFPRWSRTDNELIFETKHFGICSGTTAEATGGWMRPDDIERQNLNLKRTFEFVENFWTYMEAAGVSMPYWRRPGPNYKHHIFVTPRGAGGGFASCAIGACSGVALAHEFFHGRRWGKWPPNYFDETTCNAGQHTAFPGELQMFNGNFRYPWRNVNRMKYQSSLWCFVLGDNPNWGYGIPVVAGWLASPAETTPYHTIARLGQKKGLWKNGIRGFGDFFGEYAARTVTCDFIEQYLFRCKYGMPEQSYVYPVYGHENRYRISNAEAPRFCGFNIIRLKPDQNAEEITVDFQGIHEPAQHSDWRACIVAVDGTGRARYSPLWNKGAMRWMLNPSDKHLWLTVSAVPSAFPDKIDSVYSSGGPGYLCGPHAPRYPWEVTLCGCEPGLPHRKQGDVVNFDELYGMTDSGNTYLNYSVKQEVPIPLTEADGPLAQQKLAAMLPRIEASSKALEEKIAAGVYGRGYWERKKTMRLGDLTRRVKFLQRNAKGRRHGNGGGFVADNSNVAATAYVGPNAMVLDGATVKDNACVKEFAVVLGPKTVIQGNAKVGGRAWVFGDIKVGGNARILEAATVSTIQRTPRSRFEGRAEITGNAVIKGEHFLLLSHATDQTLTGGLVMDYTPNVSNDKNGVFTCGRFCQGQKLSEGTDAGALYVNWEFNQPRTVLLEDSYINNNGILHGRPTFTTHDGRRCIIFNGKDGYAEAPPAVADFGELTIDTMISVSGGRGGRIFDFGTGDDACFYLTTAGDQGRPTLVARHEGRSHRLVATKAIDADKWVRVRVEMDGAQAAIFIHGEPAGRKEFPFRPRAVFVGARPEGHFIACGRNKTEFFNGKMDHFRIYRTVHDDFDALGEIPSPLIQIHERSEKPQPVKHYTTADWEDRTAEEIAGKVPPKMRKWLLRVRGY